MLKRVSVHLDPAQTKRLRRIGKSKGGVKAQTLIRVAIAEFIERHTNPKAEAPEVTQ